jgi:hypothetical protein
MENSKNGSICLHLIYPPGKPENFRSRVTKGSQYDHYDFTLGALALKPSDFCNIGVYLGGGSISTVE